MTIKFLGAGGSSVSNFGPDATGRTFAGKAPAGSTVAVLKNGTQDGTATADASGLWTYTFAAAPAAGDSVVARASVNSPAYVVPAMGAAQLSISGVPSAATQSSPFTFTPTISGGTAPYSVTYSVPNGANGKPTAFTVNSATGAVTGTTAQTGTFTFRLTATDSTGHNAVLDVSIVVGAATVGAAQAIVLPGAPLAVYSLRKYGSYAGPCIRVRRETDNAEQDIGFNGAALDIAAAQTFAGVLTRLRVAKAYDLTGNANHATNTNPANQPLLQLDRTINGLPTITFDGTGSGTTVLRYLDLPTTLAPDRATNSMFFVGALNVSKQTAAAWEFSQSSIIYTAHTNKADPGFQVYNGNTSHVSGLQPPVNPMVLGIVSGAASSTIYVADKSDIRAGGLGSQALPGGRIGGSLAGAAYNGQQDMFAFVVYGSALSASDVAAVQSGAKAAFLFDDSFAKQVIFDGDSITEGYGTAGLRNYVNKTIPALNSKARAYNLGVFGQTFGAMLTDGVARVDSLYGAGFTRNVVSIAAGSNDIANGVSAASLQTTFQNYCTARRAKGFKIVAHTILPRTDYTGAQEAQRAAYNTWLRANWATYADALADWAADSVMGAANAAADPTLYGDGTHPPDAGYTRLATITTTAINSVL